MPSNKKRLNNAKLYLILDTQVLNYHRLLNVLKESVRFGIDVVQLRDKFGKPEDILLFSQKALRITKGKIPFILNDRVDLARITKADGVHLGQDDISCQDARKILGPKAIIGVSCQTEAHVKQAQRDGADYVGFGSVFKTLTKPERDPMDLKLLKRVIQTANVPLFAIGGINQNNVLQVVDCGVTRVAVCRDILLAKSPKDMIKGFKNILKGT